MSNETGKEIYKEYVNKYWFDCKHDQDREELNNQYLFQWTNTEFKTGGSYLEVEEKDKSDFIELKGIQFQFIKRAPKTQMINGHEVVAPRYDMPSGGGECHYMNFMQIDGVQSVAVERMGPTSKGLASKFGWFDSHRGAIAYANAHRESKQ